MKIDLTINGKALTATLLDHPTARDFASLLPLRLAMEDLFRREKFARLPRALAEGGERTRSYDVGDVVYWSPGRDIAVFYGSRGPSIPPPGIIVLGKLDHGMDALQVPGSVEAAIALATPAGLR
jgi:hypothetical protein